MFKARLPTYPALARAYATRLPQRPPPKVKDPLANNPHAASQSLPGDLTFIHRPPPSAATPESYTTAPSSPLLEPLSANAQNSLPPVLFPKTQPEPPRMSDEDIARMKQLRAEDPVKWTAGKLAKTFNCTQMFVRLKASLKKDDKRIALAKRDAEHEMYRARRGAKATLVKQLRDRRREFW